VPQWEKVNLIEYKNKTYIVDILGRGRQVISVAKTADLILMMLDATKGDTQAT